MSLLNLCAVKLRLYRDRDIIWNSQQGKNLRGVASEKSMRGKPQEEKFWLSSNICIAPNFVLGVPQPKIDWENKSLGIYSHLIAI